MYRNKDALNPVGKEEERGSWNGGELTLRDRQTAGGVRFRRVNIGQHEESRLKAKNSRSMEILAFIMVAILIALAVLLVQAALALFTLLVCKRAPRTHID